MLRDHNDQQRRRVDDVLTERLQLESKAKEGWWMHVCWDRVEGLVLLELPGGEVSVSQKSCS